ncbi:MAG TPA: hemerythrin domain-containing protein [Stellaceae bacterium]|nr:hemerythrin domain-containing protein [Stellaceae bacterium]
MSTPVMSVSLPETRRTFILASGVIGTAALLGGCDSGDETSASVHHEYQPKEVTADEDLLREHGVLRRALLVYSESAVRLRRNPVSVPADALRGTAQLFRRFGEDYHERSLEEPYVFPVLRRAPGTASRYVDILISQHNRGREITDFVLQITGQGRVSAMAEALAQALTSFVWMYENHATREDTVVLPAWEDALSGSQYGDMTGLFQQIERQTFGEDGFADAVARIGRIEEAFGMADLAQFTAPPLPRSPT